MSMYEWLTMTCPKCGTLNWWSNGDVSDLTVPDIEAVECYRCDAVWDTTDEQKIVSHPDRFNVERGRDNPSSSWASPKCIA